MKKDIEHWQYEDHRQRITTEEWKKLLLEKDENIIYHGRLRRLLGKRIAPGIYEIYKEPLCV